MTINIKEHSIKFGFGLYFIGKAIKQQGTDLQKLLVSLSKNPIADTIDLMFYSAKCEAELDAIDLPITKRDFLEHLESNNDFNNEDGDLAKWSAGLIESIQGNFLPIEDNAETTETGEKKK